MSKEHVYILLAGVAYAVGLSYIGGPSFLNLVIASVLLVIAAVIKAQRNISEATIPFSRVHVILAGYVVLLIVLLYTSTLTENTQHFAWLFALFPLIVYLFADVDETIWCKAFFAFSITSLFGAGWTIVEMVSSGYQANGPVIDPNTWAAIGNLGFLAMLVIYFTREESRWPALIAAIVIATGVFSAYSRAGLLVFFSGFAAIALVVVFHPDLRKRLAVLAVAVLIAFTAVHSYSGFSEARERPAGFTVLSDGWDTRFSMWQGAIAIYREAPVFGTGPGTFRLHYPRFRTEVDMKSSGNFAHNDFIQFLAEGGPMLAGVLYAFSLLLLVGLFRHGIGAVRGDRRQLEPFLLVVAMGSSLVHALVNFPLYQLQIQMLLGLLFARYIAVNGWVRLQPLEMAQPVAVRALVVIAALLVVVPTLLDLVSDDIVMARKQIPVVRNISSNAAVYLETMSFLSTVRPQQWKNRFAMSAIYRRSFDQLEDSSGKESLAIVATIEGQRALELNPFHEGVREYLIEFLRQNPWLEDVEGVNVTAEGLLREMVRLRPIDTGNWMALADFLESTGQPDEAYDIRVNHALPRIRMFVAGYKENRYLLALQILREARARGDEQTLQRLLDLLE